MKNETTAMIYDELHKDTLIQEIQAKVEEFGYKVSLTAIRKLKIRLDRFRKHCLISIPLVITYGDIKE